MALFYRLRRLKSLRMAAGVHVIPVRSRQRAIQVPARVHRRFHNGSCLSIMVSMRIVCPNCTAAYEVPASRMATPRKVRCQRCGREWLAAPEPDEATQPDIPPPEVEHPLDHEDPVEATLPPVTAMDRLSASAPRPRTMPTLMAAWVMTFV